jgi:hypothetical protein
VEMLNDPKCAALWNIPKIAASLHVPSDPYSAVWPSTWQPNGYSLSTSGLQCGPQHADIQALWLHAFKLCRVEILYGLRAPPSPIPCVVQTTAEAELYVGLRVHWARV